MPAPLHYTTQADYTPLVDSIVRDCFVLQVCSGFPGRAAIAVMSYSCPPGWPTYKLWSTGKMVKTCWLVTEGREALPSQFVCVEPKLLLWAEQCKHAEDSWVNINKVKLKWIFLITFFKVSTEHWQIGQIEHGLNYIKKLFEGLCQT